MSRGGFTASVRITKTEVGGGFTNSSLYNEARMELEGKLDTFWESLLESRIDRKAKASVSILIEFTKPQEITDRYDGGAKSYIGVIGLVDYRKREKNNFVDDDTEMSAYVELTLPIEMLSQISLFEGKLITFDTIHDIVKNPTEDQKADGTVAFVKRVYFEVSTDLPPEPKKKRSFFGTG